MDTRLSRKVIWDVINTLILILILIASPRSIFAKIASLQGATLAFNSNRRGLAIFRHFRHCMHFSGHKCRTYCCCFPLALPSIRLWPLVPFFQISLKNTELKTTHNTFQGIVACIFSDNFLEIAVCIWVNSSCVVRIAMARLFWCSSICLFAACRFSFLTV